MSTNTRITRSKGKSYRLSLPTRMRPTRKETILGKEGGMVLNTTFNADLDQHHQQTPTYTPLPTSPTSDSQPSQLSAPLFKEDRYTSTLEEETEADAEVTLINCRNQLNRTFAHNSTTEKPMSTLTTTDYTTQDDPNQISLSTPHNIFMSTATETEFLGTNNFFIPDGSDRCIHQIHNKDFHAGYLENGNNAYLLELPALEKMLNT